MNAVRSAVQAEALASADVPPLGPESLWWRVGLDRTALLVAGRSLVMQVAHPTIGAAVGQHSTFRQDPWGRLERTVTSLERQIFGGELAVEEARVLRERHAKITGTGFDGKRYAALNPKAYAWVHLANFDSAVTWRTIVGRRPLGRAAHEQLYAEWRQAGLVLGIRDADMPHDVAGFEQYIEQTVQHTLELNPTVTELLETLTLQPVPPPGMLPEPVWAALKPAGRTVLYDFTVGTLPVALREKLGLSWTPAADRRLAASTLAVRTARTLVPHKVRDYPLAHEARRAARRHRRQSTR